MNPVFTHDWSLSESDAMALQARLASQVITSDQFERIERIAGVDVAYRKDSNQLVAAVSVIDAHTLAVIESATIVDQATFPYIPGLFSFRELPALVSAFAKLKYSPDLVVCDGQGLAHPRRFGLACHLGLVFDIPSIGCGKTRLVGEFSDPGLARGAQSSLIDHHEVVGKVLRTQDNVKPVYVSIGHRVSLDTACDWVLALAPKYRLPETTRQADQLVNATLKQLR